MQNYWVYFTSVGNVLAQESAFRREEGLALTVLGLGSAWPSKCLAVESVWS